MKNCTFIKNFGFRAAGGLMLDAIPTVTIIDVVFIENSS